MTHRSRVAYDPDGPHASAVRMWLLQLGVDPVTAGDQDAPQAPQRADVERDEVAAFVRGLTGRGHTRGERFDDHGSAESWPRGSY